jgi:hypothetical protein
MFLNSKTFSLLIVFVIAGLLIYSVDPALAQVAGLTDDSLLVIINRAITWLLGITAALTILFLIIGGIYYITAAGDDQQMTKAKTMISYAVVGLVFIIISLSIVVTVNRFITG